MGHLNIVLLLLQNGASPDVRNIVSAQKNRNQNLCSTQRIDLRPRRAVLFSTAGGDSAAHGSTSRSDGSGALFAEEWSAGGRHGQGESRQWNQSKTHVIVTSGAFLLLPL